MCGADVCTSTTSGGIVVWNSRGTSDSRDGTYARRGDLRTPGADERGLQRHAGAVGQSRRTVERVQHVALDLRVELLEDRPRHGAVAADHHPRVLGQRLEQAAQAGEVVGGRCCRHADPLHRGRARTDPMLLDGARAGQDQRSPSAREGGPYLPGRTSGAGGGGYPINRADASGAPRPTWRSGPRRSGDHTAPPSHGRGACAVPPWSCDADRRRRLPRGGGRSHGDGLHRRTDRPRRRARGAGRSSAQRQRALARGVSLRPAAPGLRLLRRRVDPARRRPAAAART